MKTALLLAPVLAVLGNFAPAGASEPSPGVVPTTGDRAGPGPSASPSAGLFDRLDTNGDGLIEAGEAPAEHRRLFDRLLRTSDRDRDGRLGPAELQRGLTPATGDKPITPPPSAELRDAKFARLLLLKLDADRSASLTRDEAPAELRQAFARIAENADRNNDGVVSRFELNRSGPRVIGIGRRFAGRLGWEVDAELARFEREQGRTVYRFDEPIGPMEALSNPQAARQLFNQLDSNGDQLLTRDELPEQLRDRFARLFRRADVNRDDALSRAEYLEASQRLTRFLERTGLTPSEPPSAGTPTADAAGPSADPGKPLAERLMQRWLQRADRNRDGRVARSEATGPMAQRFEEADLDQDGVLDAEELAEATRRLADRLRRTGRNTALSDSAL